jgi:hypothetical protein
MLKEIDLSNRMRHFQLYYLLLEPIERGQDRWEMIHSFREKWKEIFRFRGLKVN